MIASFLAFTMAFGAQSAEAGPIHEEDEVYPAEFRGSWAPTLAACKSEDGQEIIAIGRSKIWAYEADSKLLKVTPEFHFTAPNGAGAKSIHAIVAERGETDVGIGKLRLTLSGGKLYVSRIDDVPEDKQWENPHVRCPTG